MMPPHYFSIQLEKSIEQQQLVIIPSSSAQLLALLKKSRINTDSLKEIAIPPKHSFTFLENATKEFTLLLENKPLVCDFYSKPKFYFQLSPPLLIEGRLAFHSRDFALKECQLILPGPPHIIIERASLKFLDTEISWDLLKQAKEAPETIDPKMLASFLKEGESPTPQLHFLKGSKPHFEKALEPYPVLKLQDRHGAFAALWMDYGDHLLPFNTPHPPPPFPRNLNCEKAWENDLLETTFEKKQTGNAHYFCPLNQVNDTLSFLLECGWKVLDAKNKQLIAHSKTALAVSDKNNALEISGTYHFDTHTLNIAKIAEACQKQEPFVPLDQESVGLLSSALKKELAPLLAEAVITTETLTLARHAFGTLQEPLQNAANLSIDPSVPSFQQLKKADPDKSFTGTLRPYQQVGVNWLSALYDNQFHGILADEMGLGKTVQVLAFLSTKSSEKQHLIIAPTSLLFNWKREIQRFLPTMTAALHHGPNRSQDALPKAAIIITSFATLRQDLPLFSHLSFHCLIVDEAQAIKNRQTKTAQAVRTLQARLRLSLTGTPVENRSEELFSHFHFLMPKLLGSLADFQAKNSHDLKQKIQPFILRRQKTEVAKQLPELIEQTVWVEMGEQQRALYEQMRSRAFNKEDLTGKKTRIQILETILRLRQICCHPLLISNGDISTSAKLDALMGDLETVVENGSKVLIFSQFTTMLTLIKREIERLGYASLTLDGSTKEREKVVTEFQQNHTIPIFLISLKAGGVGLNLTAADYVFLFDPWWNSATEEQAISRAHRMGQDKRVIVKRYLTLSSIEENVQKLKEKKEQLVSSLISDPLSFTEDELLSLI